MIEKALSVAPIVTIIAAFIWFLRRVVVGFIQELVAIHKSLNAKD